MKKEFIEAGKSAVKMIVVVTLIKATVIGLSVMANAVLDNYKK